MKFIDLKTQFELLNDEIHNGIEEVLRHGKYVSGPEVVRLEEKLADFVGVRHCVSVSSGTDALVISLMALDIGIGDEVITSPFTFAASAEAICLVGATPKFVDIRPDTLNLDESKIEEVISENTRAIMPISIFGQCANFEEINRIADTHGLVVIEDGAQSFGATYKGSASCGLSTIGCTSFFPSKPLGAYGDGGACFCNEDEIADKMRMVREHGQSERYVHTRLGVTGRLDSIQASVLLAKLRLFPGEIERRQQIAEMYNKELGGYHSRITCPTIATENTSVYAQYTIEVNDREQFIMNMTSRAIPTAVHYPRPLYEQPVFRTHSNVDVVSYPVTEMKCKRVVSLPMHPYLTDGEIGEITDAVLASASA